MDNHREFNTHNTLGLMNPKSDIANVLPDPSSPFALRETYITIDSRDRDTTVWPSASYFQVRMEPDSGFAGATLNRNYKNIKSIELVSAVYPNTNNVLKEMYLYLIIPEIDGVYDATNRAGLNAFAKLIPHHTVGDYVYTYNDYIERQKKIYNVRGQRLDRLTLQFAKYDGTTFDFNADGKTIATSVTLKIVTVDPFFV